MGTGNAGSLLQPPKDVKAEHTLNHSHQRSCGFGKVTKRRCKSSIFNQLLDYFGGSIGL
jgi:hypothetical protein